jgi:hypothetical protein
METEIKKRGRGRPRNGEIVIKKEKPVSGGKRGRKSNKIKLITQNNITENFIDPTEQSLVNVTHRTIVLPVISEPIMYENDVLNDRFRFNTKVYNSGKVIVSIYLNRTQSLVNVLDYPSLDTLRKRIIDKFSLAYAYMHTFGESFVDNVENQIFN